MGRGNSSRPSLAASTSGAAPDATGKKVDESFLARMMRPTASSASKVREEAKKAAAGAPSKVKAATNGVRRKVEKKAESPVEDETVVEVAESSAGPADTAAPTEAPAQDAEEIPEAAAPAPQEIKEVAAES